MDSFTKLLTILASNALPGRSLPTNQQLRCSGHLHSKITTCWSLNWSREVT